MCHSLSTEGINVSPFWWRWHRYVNGWFELSSPVGYIHSCLCPCHRACAYGPVPSSLCHRSPTQWRMIMKMMMIPSSTRWKLEMTSVVDEPNVLVAATSNRSHLSMAMGSSTNDYTLCEVFESMESMALRAQTDVGLFWWRTYTLLMMTRHGWELHPVRWDILIIPDLIAHLG